MTPIFRDARRRYAWALKRRNALERSVNHYKQAYPIDFRAVIAEDRLSWQIHAVVKREPRLRDWAYWYASIVHDLRSILDNCVWAATHAVKAPEKPNLLEFPIVADSAKWLSGAARIREVPLQYRQRIEQYQPFNRPPTDGIGAALRLLHELDVQNKHHAPVITSVSKPQEYRHEYKIMYKVDPKPTEKTTTKIFPFKFKDQQMLWDQKVPQPIERIEQGVFSVSAHFVVHNEQGVEYPLLGSLDIMFEACHDVITTFESTAASMGLAR